MLVFKKHKNTLLTITAILVSAVFIGFFVLFSNELSELFNKTYILKEFVLSFGFFAPIAFIFLQFLQVIFAPIPGNAVVVLGGIVFGGWGLLYGLIGAMLGYYVIFLLSHKFGRPLAEKLFKKKTLDKFDYITKGRGDVILFTIFILPFFPDDIVCYLAGLTKVPIKKLMIAAFLGRVPSFLLTNLIGMGVGNSNIWLTATVTTISLLIGIVYWWKREPIDKFIRKLAKKRP